MLGAQLICEGAPGGRLSRNQLVALRFEDAGDFSLGTTAWASVTLTGQLRIGVRYLPGMARAVDLRGDDADQPVSGNPVPAFLLQAVPGLGIPPSLIIQRGWFKPGREVAILHRTGKGRLPDWDSASSAASITSASALC